MYSKIQLGLKFLNYYIKSSNGKGHGIHSPFVFHFISQILNDKNRYPQFELIENLRQELLKDQRVLSIEDLGAGSSTHKANQRSVSSIANSAVKTKKYSQLLFRMVRQYKPKTIIELGTSLGITTSYLAMANTDAKIITMEGAMEIAAIASQSLSSLKVQNAKLVNGNFDSTLSRVISELSSVDFAFIDGNHRRQPTERYFLQLLSKADSNSIFVFDDIHWSKEMEQAWKTIQDSEAVRCSIDLFFVGIVFFRKEFKEKQHFVIRF